MREATASSLVGGAGSWPFGGPSSSKDVSRGGCESGSLGSLSADGLGCIPTLLVVWPEISQCWSLQADDLV